MVESFFCQLSSQLGSHLSVLVKPFFKRLFGLVKIVWGTFFAAGQSQQELYAQRETRELKTIFRVVCNLPIACEQ